MNLNQLRNKTSKYYVNLENGEGELISFTHQVIGETILDIKCLPQSGSYRHLNDERVKDAMSFMVVFLDNPPEKSDIITYNGIDWKVELFDGTNPYDIVCYRKKKTTSVKPSR